MRPVPYLDRTYSIVLRADPVGPAHLAGSKSEVLSLICNFSDVDHTFAAEKGTDTAAAW